MDGVSFLELRGIDSSLDRSDRVCWVCDGSGGKYHNCPECGGGGFNPRRPVPPLKNSETKLLLALAENRGERKD